jgi:hypothetical protein
VAFGERVTFKAVIIPALLLAHLAEKFQTAKAPRLRALTRGFRVHPRRLALQNCTSFARSISFAAISPAVINIILALQIQNYFVF